MQKNKNQKNAVIALKKFNSMYEEVTSKNSTETQYSIVFNYGTFMLKQFPEFFSNHVETPGKVKALGKAVVREKNSRLV